MRNEITQLQIKAATGDAASQFRLGQALAMTGDIDRACTWFRRAAEQGMTSAQRELALVTLFGLAGRHAPGEGEKQLREAADAGDAGANYWLAALAPLRDDCDWPDTLARLHRAAQQDDPLALRSLALLTAAGDDPLPLTRLLLDRAARSGDNHSRLLLHTLPGNDIPAAPDTAWPQEIPSLPLPAAQVLCADPYIATIDDAFSPLECTHVIELGRRFLRPSLTVDPNTGQGVAMPLRTSHSMQFEAFQEDFWLRLMQSRLGDHFQSPLAHCEPLTLLRYQTGEEYRPHRDYLPPARLATADGIRGGQRRFTAFVYLNPVESGGETDFPGLGIRIAPKQGRAVFFRNTDADGSPDPRTLHAGTPVIAGEKWLATLWIRERAIRQP